MKFRTNETGADTLGSSTDMSSTVYCYDKKQVYFHSPAGIVPLKCWYL